MLGKLNKFITACVLTLFPIISKADPVTSAIAAWYATASAFTVAIVAAQGFLVAYSIYGSSQQRKAAEEAQEAARREYNAGLRDRTITRVATEAPYRYIYGQSRVGSDIVAVFSSGDKDQYKHLVCVHAAHECESIEDIYIAGEALGTLDANGDVTSGKFFVAHTDNIKEFPTGGNIGPGIAHANDVNIYRAPINTLTFTTAKTVDLNTLKVLERFFNYDGDNAVGMYKYLEIPATVVGSTVTLSHLPTDPLNVVVSYTNSTGTSRVRVKKHLGTPTDPADASLIAELPDKWTAAATLRGFCYTVIRLDLNQPEFQGGIPTIEPLIKGKKLYDPRTGLTVWSSNPALAIYDYLTSEICGVPATDLPVAQYITAANVCDESSTVSIRIWVPKVGSVPAHTEVVTGSYPKYTINGTVTSDQSQSKMLEAMAQCMAGSIVSTTWDIAAGKYVAPVKALYQEDIVGSLAITPGISDADIYNGIKGQYIDPANKYVATDYVPYQNALYLSADGRDLFNSIDFQFTNNLQGVHNLCRIFTEDQRNGFTIKAEFSLKAWGLKVGQRVTFTSSFLGQTNKVYRITDKRYSPNSAVELTLKEDAATIWDNADSIVLDDTPNTDLPDPFAIAPLTSITCSSGSDALLLQSDGTIVSRILVTWPAATTQAVLTNGYIEVQWQNVTDIDWQSTQAGGSDTQVYLSPVQDGGIYIVRARCVNPYLNVKSNWVYSYAEAIGKTAAPPNVASMTIKIKADGTRQYSFDTTGQPVDVVSGGGYRIKYRLAGTSTAWADMTSLHTGLLTQSPYETNQPLPGVYDFGIEAVDSSGNGSAGAYLVSDVVMTDGDFTDAKTDTAVAADTVEGFIARINALISANKAETAQATADAATADITNIVSDSVLAKGEKSTVILDYNAILGEQAGIDSQATALSITTEKTAYDSAITALTAYLTGLSPAYDDTTTNTAIVAATFRQKFVDVYTAKQVLMNMFASKASTLATWTGIVGTSGTINTGNIASIVGSNAVGTAQIADAAIATAKIADNAATDTVSLSSTGQDPTAMNSGLTVSYTPPNSCVATLSLSGGTATSTGGGIGGSVTFQTPLTVGFTQGGSALGPAAPINLQGSGSLSTQYDGMINLSIKVSLTAGVPYTFGVALTNGRYLAPSVSYGVLSNSLVLKLEVIKK